MQSKFWVGVLSFAGLALVAFAQDEGVEATSNKTGITQVAPGSGGAQTEAADLNSEETASSATADDNYTPTERISEDRSVSFLSLIHI